jgi:hypothetical protein
MLQDRVTALRTANIYERQSYRHIVGLPVIGANPADGIAAETPFLVARIMRDGRTDLFVTGVYLDKIRDEAGSLRFVERLVVCDSGHFDTLLAIPPVSGIRDCRCDGGGEPANARQMSDFTGQTTSLDTSMARRSRWRLGRLGKPA